jgi:hyperosmotically inducible protein
VNHQLSQRVTLGLLASPVHLFEQKSKGFISAVVMVVTLAMVACASTRTQKSAGEQVDDSVTTASVKAALIADPVTKAHQIDVETFKGTVQLNGYVDTSASKERASEVAKSTKGVTAVRNNLTVKTTERSGEQVVDDGAITTKVKTALAGDPRTKAHQINIETREGVVQLSGFVDSSEAKSTAEELARAVDNVKSVDNELDVKK